jgi:hypothetical protein
MANVDRPNGFKPVKHLSGAPYNGQARKYMVSSSETVALAIGDLVKLSDSAATDGYAAVEVLDVAGGDKGGPIVGSIVGVVPVNETGSVSGGASPTLDTPQHRVGSTKRFVWVADSPDLLFEAQEDSDSVNVVLADIGKNFAVLINLPNTSTGTSTMEIDSSSVHTTSTLPLQIMGAINRPDNEFPGANARYLVRINTHAYGNVGVAGV